MKTFPTFWFEGYRAFRTIDNATQLKELVAIHQRNWKKSFKSTVWHLKKSRRNDTTFRKIPEFGLYGEHEGKETLEDYLKKHNIEWPKEQQEELHAD